MRIYARLKALKVTHVGLPDSGYQCNLKQWPQAGHHKVPLDSKDYETLESLSKVLGGVFSSAGFFPTKMSYLPYVDPKGTSIYGPTF